MVRALRNFENQTKTPHIVLLHVGTNDLDCKVFHRDVKNFLLLIQAAKDKFSQSKIFIYAILAHYDDDCLNCKAYYLNIILPRFANQNFLTFVNFLGIQNKLRTGVPQL